MNILLLHYSAPPVVGGVESIIQSHARLMADAGHRVRILAGRGTQVDEGVPFVCLPLADSVHPEVLAVKGELDRGIVSPKFNKLVGKIGASLEDQAAGMDILIAHNIFSLHKNLALTAAVRDLVSGKQSPRLILWHHDLAWTTPRYLPELHPGHPWDLLRTPAPAAIHVAVSELRRDELARLLGIPKEAISVVPSGVDLARFFKLEDRTRQIVRKLDLTSAAPLLLLPVRITPRKNIELAVRVLGRLRCQYPHTALVVTGPPDPHNPENRCYFEQLRGIRRELGLDGAVHFLAEMSDEYLSDKVIADFYRLADALIITSREEGFGIPILEGALSGLPVFCSDLPPLRQLAGDQAGYFSPDADPGEVAGLIFRRLSSDPGYLLRSRFRRQFSWETIYAERIAPLLSDL